MENRTQQDNPKIYVACLAAYNAGHLHGEWINANREPREIHADIQSMLEKSPEPAAEEWAVHDYEGFGFITLSEWPDIERVSTIARLIVTHGEPFLLWYQSQDGHNCDCSELEDLFLDRDPKVEPLFFELV